jgi:hypothetical protein
MAQIEEAISGCWSPETCDPVDLPDWSVANPARGQCAVTALVVQDLLGGDLLLAEVRNADGSRQGVHYWNRLCGGLELDLTRSQFNRGEFVGVPDVAPRPSGIPQGRLAQQYHVLSERVAARLRFEAEREVSMRARNRADSQRCGCVSAGTSSS